MKKQILNQILNVHAFFLRLIYHKAGAVETIVFTVIIMIISMIIAYSVSPKLFN